MTLPRRANLWEGITDPYLVLVLLSVGRRLIVAFTNAEEHQPHQPKSYETRKEYAEDHRNPFVRAHRPFD